MNKNQINIILLILIALTLIFGYLNLSIKSEYKEKKSNYINFENSSYAIFQIKKMQKRSKNIINELKRIKQPSITKRVNSTVYLFDNLNSSTLNALLRKIKGSFLNIKTLEIKRDTTNHAMISLEVGR